MSDRLTEGQQLNINDQLVSSNGKVRLIQQGDGNLVLYRTDNNVPLWASNTWQKPVQRAVMQADGNLVCYDGSNAAYWAAGTYGHAGAYAVLQDDGNLVIYQGGIDPNLNGAGALWASNTMQNWGQPSLPQSVDSGDVHVDTGDWMHSQASINGSGVISGTTHTWCTVALRGFTGSCCPILFNTQGLVIWPNNMGQAKHQYGVDGSAVPFTTSNRTDSWQNQVDSGTLAQATKLGFMHWHDPKNRLLADIMTAQQTIPQIIQTLETVYNIIVTITSS